MKIILHNVYLDTSTPIEGTSEDIRNQLMIEMPWLSQYGSETTLIDLLHIVSAQQMFDLHIEEDDGLLSDVEPELIKNEILDKDKAFEAVRFMTNGKPISNDEMRAFLWDEDGDSKKAALQAYKQPVSDENVKAVAAWINISNRVPEASVKQEVEPISALSVVPEGKDSAEALTRAFNDNKVFTASFHGKHSTGAMVGTDPETQTTFFLKPDDSSGQAQKEAAFYYVAEELALGQYIPKADWLQIGVNKMAAIKMLNNTFHLLEDEEESNPGLSRLALKPYLDSGALHRWAVLDWILANPDRHGRNMMVSHEKKVALIDHGATFREGFDPARDKYSFVPFYLRAWALSKFNNLSLEDKAKIMPRTNQMAITEIYQWINQIDTDKVSKTITMYHLQPNEVLDRIKTVKLLPLADLDLSINMLWVK